VADRVARAVIAVRPMLALLLRRRHRHLKRARERG